MMKQRRRMLMAKQINLEKLFETATYITGGGADGEETGTAYILKSYLLSNQKYYLFGYRYNDFAIFTYYNGNIIKIYQKYSTASLSIDDEGTGLRLYFGSSYDDNSLGLIALTFGYDADLIFENLFDEIITGGGSNLNVYITLPLSSYTAEGKTKYFFVGNLNRFCVYKAIGITYSDLTAIYNHNLYLINYGDTSVRLSTNNSTAAGLYGYTALCAKG